MAIFSIAIMIASSMITEIREVKADEPQNPPSRGEENNTTVITEGSYNYTEENNTTYNETNQNTTYENPYDILKVDLTFDSLPLLNQEVIFRITLLSEIDITNLSILILLPEVFISSDIIHWNVNLTTNISTNLTTLVKPIEIGNHTIQVNIFTENHTFPIDRMAEVDVYVDTNTATVSSTRAGYEMESRSTLDKMDYHTHGQACILFVVQYKSERDNNYYPLRYVEYKLIAILGPEPGIEYARKEIT